MTHHQLEARCPNCNTSIELEDETEIGERLTCVNCWADLVVTTLQPPGLDWYTFDDEDFSDEEDDPEEGYNK